MLVYDDVLRDRVISGQRRRLSDFGLAPVERALDSMIASLP